MLQYNYIKLLNRNNIVEQQHNFYLYELQNIEKNNLSMIIH